MRVDAFYSIQRQINQSKNRLDRVINQLAANKRIVSAKDDIAGTAVLNKIKSTLNSLKTANEKNIAEGSSLIDIAEGAATSISDKRKELLALAQEASDPLIDDLKRAELQIQFAQGLEDLNDIAEGTTYNGKVLLDGSLDINLQTGSEKGESLKIKLSSLTTSGLSLDDLDISTLDGAQKAEKYLTAASSRVDTVFSQINAVSKSLDFRENANAVQIENLEKARSNLEDLNLPEATAELSLQESLYESQVSLLTSSLSTQESVFDLLWRRTR